MDAEASKGMIMRGARELERLTSNLVGSDRHTNEVNKKITTARSKVKNKARIYVGELGEAVIDTKGKIWAYLVLEEDDTISWQLHPDENSDFVLESRKVKPLDKNWGGTL
jgi:hypothetical protein